MMKKYLLRAFAAGLAFIVGAVIAANLPFITPQAGGSDPIGAINGLIGQLNGGPGYTGTPQIVGLGPVCVATGTSPVTCNGQRGVVNFNAVTVAGNTQTQLQILNSFVNPGTICVISNGQNPPGATAMGFVGTQTAGQINISFVNASATTTGSVGMTANFICM